MTPVSAAAPAKLNLFLHITGRADGYHMLESLVAFAEYGDRLTVVPADTLTLEISITILPMVVTVGWPGH